MDLTAIQQYLQDNGDNEEVKAFVGKLSAPTVDGVKGFLESHEDGKRLFQSLSDSRVSQAIESWKGNNLSKIIEEEVAKRNPQETPEQKQIRELREMIEAEKQKSTKAEMLASAQAKATEYGLPISLVPFVLGDSAEATVAGLDKLKAEIDAIVAAKVQGVFKENGRDPHNTGGNPPTSVEKLQKLYDEAVKSGRLAEAVSFKNQLFEAQRKQ